MRIPVTAYGISFLLPLVFFSHSFAQQVLTGRIHKKASPEVLPAVSIHNLNQQKYYQLDSIKRKEDYAWLDKVHREKLAGGKRFSDGVGISFSPLSYFNHVEMQRRRLRKPWLKG